MIFKKSSHTAILVFAASGKKDAWRKGIKGGDVLFDTLTDQTVALASKTGLPYFVHTEKQQKGFDFGSRLSNSIQAVFEQGYDNVIAIGNDTPHLKLSHFKQAIGNLEQGVATIGPSQDGGFYLLGINKATFLKVENKENKESSFSKLPWKTSRLTCSLTDSFSNGLVLYKMLDKLIDLDASVDLRAILDYSLSLNEIILQLILLLVESDKSIASNSSVLYLIKDADVYYNKGSPCC
ncbi:hypothetical protein LY01_00127 [Nonlabens xylanidelens]|uniref:Glycosyltransferase A (GT-A) superfamily protein (DUF2064 family) n=1 Tax=Nonlabens xylanidelens TaxID=191564 RepID=A0A2S6IPZ6_9FLAO|nr:DUF2064 domain-containing protein [Nonlabens xylanidelens]PPK96309.1 hypothetical protein LY01_00127 [Nonlabens xylanidelens]PQJ18038.1 hypothetical protein BST94_08490 [Nonlabens xylanidelens]